MTSSAACRVAVLVIEPANMPSVWPILMPKTCPSPSATSEAGDDRDQRQQIVFAARGAGHALEELPSVEDADAVEEHDQSGEADRSDDLRLRREGADGEADEQHGSDAEREAAEIDLADQVAEADGEKDRKDRLRPDDVAGEIEHGNVSGSKSRMRCSLSDQRTWQPAARNWSITRSIRSGVGVGVFVVLVFKIHRLPLEGAELVERLHLDPLDVLHRRDELRDALDIGRIVGEARHQREAHPDRLADRREPLGEAQRRRQIAAGDLLDRSRDPSS